MNQTLLSGQRYGEVTIPASKSQAHRLFIAAALSEAPVTISCDGISNDISATIDCMNALGADIRNVSGNTFSIKPVGRRTNDLCLLKCGESGSTLRFLVPVSGAFNRSVVFHREGRLPDRPLEPLMSELKAYGMTFREDGADLYAEGRLKGGSYTLPGNVSSQYITGLLMALPFCDEDSELTITGNIESAAYITMTEKALMAGGISFTKTKGHYTIPGRQKCRMPEKLTVEADWSNAAFFLSMGALSDNGLTVKGLSPDSAQGDKSVIDVLKGFGADILMNEDSIFIKKQALHSQVVDAAPIPDLIPVLSVVASVCDGQTRFINAGRLRLKESDRLESTAALINRLGGNAAAEGDTLIVNGVANLKGGSIDTYNDHRIAMSAAVAACVCTGNVEVMGSECVKKSYPRFWDDYNNLCGGRK